MKEDKVYPAFYKSLSGNLYLHRDRKTVSHVVDGACHDWVSGDFSDGHESDTNITREYLANTYGKAESKEHAEFIVELAENAGFEVKRAYKPGFAFFSFWDGKLAFLEILSAAKAECEKQITIPMPPKELEDVDEVEAVDGWPRVGSKVNWGNTSKGEVKSISDGFAWVKTNSGDYQTVYVSSLKKPKTPEEIEREEIEHNLSDLIMRARDADADDISLTRSIMSKYNITKKQ